MWRSANLKRHLRAVSPPKISQNILENGRLFQIQPLKTFSTTRALLQETGGNAGDFKKESAFAQAMKQKQKARLQDEENVKEEGAKKEDSSYKNRDDSEPKAKSSSSAIPILLGVFATYIALGQLHESSTEVPPPGETLFEQHNRKCKEALVESYEYFMNPPTKKLLPPLPPQLYREHTLCIELTDALTHLVWDVDVGWRVALRPGVKQLLYTLHQYFELVVFTNTPSHLASPVIDALDNFGLFHYRLFREHHRLDKDTHLKDLSFLNRDLSKVIVVDTTPDSLGTHPENGLLIQKWTGEKGDKVLYDYTVFLQELLVFATTQKISDIRPLLATIRSIDEKDVPKAWAKHKENIKTLIKQRASNTSSSNTSTSTASDTSTSNASSSLMGMVTSTVQALFGGSSLEGSLTKGLNKSSATTIDRIEQYCADTRKMLDKELQSHQKNVESQRKEHMEMVKKQMEEMKNSDLKLIDYLTGNFPQPGSQKAEENKA